MSPEVLWRELEVSFTLCSVCTSCSQISSLSLDCLCCLPVKCYTPTAVATVLFLLCEPGLGVFPYSRWRHHWKYQLTCAEA